MAAQPQPRLTPQEYQYRTLEGLEEYVLVSQTEARVEVFRRQPENYWLLTDFVGMDATCALASVDCSVPLAEIYDKVNFEKAMVE